MRNLFNVLIMLCLIQTKVFANSFAGGDGTESSPYQIMTAVQLDSVRWHMDSHFILMNDIDVKAEGYNIWLPLGKRNTTDTSNSFTAFTGVFDGGGHTISNVNIIYSGNYVAMFAVLAGTVKNLDITGNVNQTAGATAGLLVGYLGQASNPGLIENCSANGSVMTTGNQAALIAAIAAYPAGTIRSCSASGSVVSTGGNYVGGICGRATKNTVYITDCYSTADITGLNYVGGIIGYIWGSGNVYNTYATGKIEGEEFVGGIAGRVWDNSSTSGHLALNSAIVGKNNVGRVFGEISSTGGACENVWGLKDMPITVNGTSYTAQNNLYAKDGGDVSQEEEELLTEIYFYEDELGWDFDNVWYQAPNGYGYPVLKKPVATSIQHIEVCEYSSTANIFFRDNILNVNDVEDGCKINVYNAGGQLMKSVRKAGINNIFDIPFKGIYFVEVVGKNNYRLKVINK